MPKRMLIDAAHAEETRVVVLDGKKLEEFDFESSTKKQLKGNIYLAKVTRVEPSLQAAFLDYGGNRHGFLPFSEIHPDYYQIPVADRQALLKDEAAQHDDFEEGSTEASSERHKDSEADAEDMVESLGHDDELEEVRRPVARPRRNYKIQEVTKRRQIMLVQVVKEERGNKGAALTTYLSLAGRYCVLMPNTSRGGGISRKISNPADRKRLKSIMSDLEMPEGVACIIRTAGIERTKPEIKRDYEYLLRLWDTTRQLTLKSMAPALIYEEGSLIKRAIRDVYSREIDEVLVEGESGYRMAKDFMRLLMPSHSKKVQHYDDRIPLFHRYQVEGQLDSMFNPTVELRSGGYIVINPTEALVAVDVNSGRSTREHNIEETAYKTNLEAAEEISRQLRLRDMAGLVVVDFIDMEDNRNNRAVEKKMKDCLKADRARIQIGRISHFGLMEMSRQRLRPGVLEASTQPCEVCHGTGVIRSVESSSLQIIRLLEEEGIKGRVAEVEVHVPVPVALFLLNDKRRYIAQLEDRFNFEIRIEADAALLAPNYRIERVTTGEDVEATETARPARPETRREEPRREDQRREEQRREDQRHDEAESDDEESPVVLDADDAQTRPQGQDETRSKRRRRRRRRRGGNRPGDDAPMTAEGQDAVSSEEQAESTGYEAAHAAQDEPGDDAGTPAETGNPDGTPSADAPRKPRRRRSRSRRPAGEPMAQPAADELPQEDGAQTLETAPDAFSQAVAAATIPDDQAGPDDEAAAAPQKPARSRSRSRAKKPAVATSETPVETPVEDNVAADNVTAEKPARRRAPRRSKAPDVVEGITPTRVSEHAASDHGALETTAIATGTLQTEAPAADAAPQIETTPPASASTPPTQPETAAEPEVKKPSRRGWWQRAKSVIE